jgi:hypothetical protein
MAGTGLWPLSEPVNKKWKEQIPELDIKTAVKAVDVKHTPELKKIVQELNYDPTVRPGSASVEFPEEVLERLGQLIDPPACTACPMYVKNKNSHYCTWKPCWERKRKGWGRLELEKLSRKLNIPVFDPTTDPKEAISVDSIWDSDRDWNTDWKREGKSKHYQEIFVDEKRSATFRLRLKWSSGMYGGNEHKLTEHYLVEVVDTDAKMIKWLEKQTEAKKAASEKNKTGQKNNNLIFQQQHANLALFRDFVENVAGPIFAEALAGLDNLPLLQQFAQLFNDDLADQVDDTEDKRRCRGEIMGRVINGAFEWKEKATGPAGCAGKMAVLADAWGVRLPADWQAQAETFGQENVAAEAETQSD